ncbi:hypothetical protein NP233_g9459 [Leucocoprinus birnbaumii]|uniref:DUF6533 domain-containing protein n=1 Tax=Leucocoprinus birnbaumii TaxID=56174 RepID=A0AAD5YN63_9AGAR|nr:hypothetical protein NP233_g9459 [Leucocoprinus birnbaumii]
MGPVSKSTYYKHNPTREGTRSRIEERRQNRKQQGRPGQAVQQPVASGSSTTEARPVDDEVLGNTVPPSFDFRSDADFGPMDFELPNNYANFRQPDEPGHGQEDTTGGSGIYEPQFDNDFGNDLGENYDIDDVDPLDPFINFDISISHAKLKHTKEFIDLLDDATLENSGLSDDAIDSLYQAADATSDGCSTYSDRHVSEFLCCLHGPFEKLDNCPEDQCNASRWDKDVLVQQGKKVPAKQSYTIPIGPSLQSLFASRSSALATKYRQKFLSTVPVTPDGSKVFTDVFSREWYQKCVDHGSINNDDILLMFSIDGAQLYEHKTSDCWIYIWVIMDLPPDLRYKKHHVLPGSFIPGPGKPKNLDSSLFPVASAKVIMDARSDGVVPTLIWALQQFAVTQYCKVAFITLFAADYFYTLTTEISFLWPSPWTVVKAVFFVSRYTPFLDAAIYIFLIRASNPSSDVCLTILRTNIWSSGIGQMSAQVLLIFRAYALLGQTSISRILLSVFALVVFATGFTLVISLHVRLSVTPSPLPGVLPGCLIASSSAAEDGYAIAGIIASIIYESILFLIIYWAKRRRYRSEHSWLMKKIYNDALIYYLFSLAFAASGIIVWFSSAGPLRDLSSS